MDRAEHGVAGDGRRTTYDALLKIAALFSYCGGPLFIADVLKRDAHAGSTPFWVTIVPIGAMAMGAQFLGDDLSSRTARFFVWLGRLGLYVALGMHAYAVWCFANGVREPDQGLHYMGIVVGLVWSYFYLRASRRWSAPPPVSSQPGESVSTDPIEPS